MRHKKNFNHLGRKTGHRKSMLANMASSLILHKRIQTTTAKAKALRIYVEPLITKSKEDSTHSRRIVFSQLQNKEAVTELFREVSPKIAERPGGYTRILKTGTRLGDNADMCVIELVDYNENLLTAKEDAAAKSGRRRRRGGKKKTTETTAQVTESPVTEETDIESKTPEESTDKSIEQGSVKNESENTETPVKEAKADSEADTPAEAEEVKAEEKVEASAEEAKSEPGEKANVAEEEKSTKEEQKAESAKTDEEVNAKEEQGKDKQEDKKKEE